MAAKFATPELQARMRRAVAAIGRGVNHSDPSTELQGRKDLALVHIENQIMLGRHLLTSEECQHLAELLFSTNPDDFADIEEASADAVETTQEVLNPRPTSPTSHNPTRRAPVPDAEGEFEDDEDDIA